MVAVDTSRQIQFGPSTTIMPRSVQCSRRICGLGKGLKRGT